jgi:hypothetical protein
MELQARRHCSEMVSLNKSDRLASIFSVGVWVAGRSWRPGTNLHVIASKEKVCFLMVVLDERQSHLSHLGTKGPTRKDGYSRTLLISGAFFRIPTGEPKIQSETAYLGVSTPYDTSLLGRSDAPRFSRRSGGTHVQFAALGSSPLVGFEQAVARYPNSGHGLSVFERESPYQSERLSTRYNGGMQR